MRRLLILLALTVAPAYAQQWSGIVAPSRAVDWSGVGVPGGIPSAGWTTCNPGGTPIAAYGTQATPGSPATINTAIQNCAANHFVLLGAGTFWLNSGLVMKSGVEVRGAGPNQTIIKFTNFDNCDGLHAYVCFEGSVNFYYVSPGSNVSGGTNSCTFAGTNLTNGVYTTGATSIRLTNCGTNGPINGDYIFLDQNDDTAVGNGFLVGADKTTSPPFSLEGGTPGRCSPFNSGGPPACLSPSKPRSQNQIVKVSSGCAVKCSGAGPFDITIPAPGLYGLNWRTSQAPGAWFPDTGSMIKGAGVQGFTVDLTNTPSGTDHAGIAFFNAAENWAYNMRTIRGHRNHYLFWQAAHNTVLENYAYDSYSAATLSYGVESFIGSDNLVANNVFQHITTPITLGPSTGSAYVYNFGIDNVIAQGTLTVTQTSMSGCPGACVATYTYTGYVGLQGGFANTLPVSVKGTTNGGGQFNGDNMVTQNVTGTTFQVAFTSGTNVGTAAENSPGIVSNGTLFPFSALHDGGVNYNLYEGNIGAMIYGDVFHGTSNTNTYFRNYFVGFERGKFGAIKAYDWRSYHRYWNVIGNLLGRTGTHTIYENYTGCSSGCTGGNPVYEIGFGNTNGTVTVQPDTQDRLTSMRWGNYDVTHPGTPQFNSSEVPSGLSDGYANAVPASQTLPSSFIFSSKPSWFTSAFATPQYPGIGPDVTGGTAIAPDLFGTTTAPGGHAYSNPAQLCYLNAPLDPAYPNGYDRGVLLFNVNTCYGATTPPPGAPTNLTGSVSVSTVTLNWTAPVQGPVTSYNSYRGTVHGGPYTLVHSGLTSTTDQDTSVPNGTWFYVVTAVNAGGESAKSNEISLTVTGGTLTVTLLPASRTYANQTVGTSSASQSVTLTNTSGAGNTVTITSISITGANSGDYSQTNNCPSLLMSGLSCTINVTFLPTAAGSRVATLTVVDNAVGQPHTVSLSGTGVSATPGVNLNPTSLNFGEQSLSTTSAVRSIILTNTGTGTLTITSVVASGDFAVVTVPATNCGGSLASLATCSLNVTFTPTATGGRTGAVTITDNAAGNPHVASLSGTGITTKCAMTGNLTLSGVGTVCQ